jgi:hypothetical protein
LAKGVTRFWLRSIEAALIALFLLFALLAWRLTTGPLTLDPIAPYIENALTKGQPGLRLRIGHAALQWRELSHRPVLTVEDVRALDASGVVAALPKLEAEISLAPLLRGAIVPEQLLIVNPALRVVRRADGTFAFGLAPGEGESGSALGAAAFIEALTAPPGAANLAGYVRRIAISHSRFELLDEATGRRWLVPDAGLLLERAGADVALTATLPVIDGGRPWTIRASGRYVAAERILDLTLALDGFHPAGVAGLATQLHPLGAVDLGVSGSVAMRFGLSETGAALDDLRFDLTGDNGTLDLPAPVNRTYAVKRLAAKGAVSDSLDHIVLERLRLEFEEGDQGGATVTVSGEGLTLNKAPTIVLDAAIDSLTLAALKHYWPAGTKENARTWIANNLNGGSLVDTHVHVALDGPRLEDLSLRELRGNATLDGIAVTYMKTMPPVEGTGGTLSIVPGEVTIALGSGHVPDRQSGRGVQVHSGSVRMTDLGTDHERARVVLDLGGDLGEVMRLIDREPLGYAKAVGIDPTAARGGAQVNLDIGFPLISDLKLDQLAIAVKARVDGAQVPDVAFGQPLTDSRLTMTLDRKGMDVTGSVALAGIPANLVWRENFGGGAFRSRYEVDATLDNAQRPLVGLAASIFAPPYIDGPVRTHVVYTTRRDGTGLLDADADLREATAAIRQLGWTKPPAAPARATATVLVSGNRLLEAQRFRLAAGSDTEIAGSARFGADGDLAALAITRGRVAETDFTGELARDASGAYDIAVRGASFNSTYFWKELGRDDARGSDSQGKQPLRIHAAFQRMWLAKEGDFRDVDLTYRQGRAGIERIDLATRVDGTAPFTFMLDSAEGKRSFHGESSAGGEVVRAVGLFGDIVGGALTIDGDVAADGTVNGRAEITNMKLVDAPVLARLLSVASLTGIVDELKGKGISFKLLRAPFSYAKSTLHLQDGEMFGTSLGLTARGSYSFAEGRMDFSGTIIPAYAINNALSAIPLLGTLLTGTEKGGGVLAATYRYQGEPATAQPSVNPLAALTPGITRRIFDIFKGGPRKPEAPAPKDPADG